MVNRTKKQLHNELFLEVKTLLARAKTGMELACTIYGVDTNPVAYRNTCKALDSLKGYKLR